MKKTALVAGATGIIGNYMVDHFSESQDWDVIGIARNPSPKTNVKFISVDLLDQSNIENTLKKHPEITHVFYAAYQDFGNDSYEQVKVNSGMFENLLNAVEKTSDNLERVLLIQGAKVYGVQHGKFKTPAKETDPRVMPPNFYYNQEDYLRNKQLGKKWDWSILRPDVVCGFSEGKPMNITMVLAIYASISKELNLPLRFPGTAYEYLAQVTSGKLLARASEWAALEPSASLEEFNITNGDFFRWKDLWQSLADYFELDIAEPINLKLQEVMVDKEELWDSMIEKYNLRNIPYDQIVSWGFGDFVLNSNYDVMSDTTKIHQYGFHEFIDSEIMFKEMFDDFKKMKLIP